MLTAGLLLWTTAADASTAAPGGNPWVNVSILVLVAAVAYPLLRRLRRAASQRRLDRWEREGLMPEQVDPFAPPADDPDLAASRRHPRQDRRDDPPEAR